MTPAKHWSDTKSKDMRAVASGGTPTAFSREEINSAKALIYILTNVTTSILLKASEISHVNVYNY